MRFSITDLVIKINEEHVFIVTLIWKQLTLFLFLGSVIKEQIKQILR